MRTARFTQAVKFSVTDAAIVIADRQGTPSSSSTRLGITFGAYLSPLSRFRPCMRLAMLGSSRARRGASGATMRTAVTEAPREGDITDASGLALLLLFD